MKMKYPLLRVDVLLCVFLFLNNVLLSLQTYQDAKKAMLFKWKVLEFEMADEIIRQGKLIPENAVVFDSDYYAPAGRFFATTPLFSRGVPSSLWEVVGQEGKLRPFPYWPEYNETTNGPSCDGVYSVFRIQIDKCNRLWAVDTGLNFSNRRSPLSCPPKILAYDLENGDREVLRYEFPRGTVYNEYSTLMNFVVESNKQDCSDTFVYIADGGFNRLVVFDYARKSSWRVTDVSFYPYTDYDRMNVTGNVSGIMAGLFGLALGPNEHNRKLYYHSFTSVKEAWIPVGILKSPTTATLLNVTQPAITVSSGERTGQSTVEVMTDDGILIYHVLPENSIVCWNSKTPFTAENQHILAKDDVNFQYITGMKLKDNNLMFTSGRYQLFMLSLQNPAHYNYRVMVIEDVERLLANTPCANNVGSDPDSYQQNAIDVSRRSSRVSSIIHSYNPGGYAGEPKSQSNTGSYQ